MTTCPVTAMACLRHGMSEKVGGVVKGGDLCRWTSGSNAGQGGIREARWPGRSRRGRSSDERLITVGAKEPHGRSEQRSETGDDS